MQKRLGFAFLLFCVLVCSAGCSGGSGGSGSVGGGDDIRQEGEGSPLTGRKLFVVDPDTDSIFVFDADADGNTAPERVLGSKRVLFAPGEVFVDEVNDELYVTSLQQSFFATDKVFDDAKIVVFARDAEETDAPKRILRGPSTRLLEPVGVFVDTANDELFVADVGFVQSRILVFDRFADGDVAPKRFIDMTTVFGFEVGVAGVYVAGDELFVIDNFAIRVFDRDSAGSAPIREIQFFDVTTEGFFFQPSAIFVDEANNEIYITLFVSLEFDTPVPIAPIFKSRILVYDRNDSGPAVPKRVIEGPSTGLFQPDDIFVDTINDEIFVSNFLNNTVTVYDRADPAFLMFPPGEPINLPPKRTLVTFDTDEDMLSGRFISGASGIFVDTLNDELFVTNFFLDTVSVFGRMDEGVAEPLRVIGSRTGLFFPNWIFVDKLNGEIFVTNGLTDRVTVYDVEDEGNVSPKRSFTTGRVSQQGIFVDAVGDEIFIANFFENSISVYDRDASENVAQKRLIRGENTGLDGPFGIFVDTVNNEIFVTNFETITVYDSLAEGDVPPKRTIEGQVDPLFPFGVFVTTDPLDPEGGEIFVIDFFSIFVYERTADGKAAPVRIIDSQELLGPIDIHVDIVAGEIFVTDVEAVLVFDILSDGLVLPLRLLFGPDTGLSFPVGLFVADFGAE